MNSELILTTKTNEDDYRSLMFFHLFQKKRGMIIFLGFAAVLSLWAIICRLTGILPVTDFYFYVCIVFWGLVALQSFVYQSSVKKFLASDKLVIGTEKRIAIREDGISVDGKDSSAVYGWDKFFRGYETKKYYYLYLNTAQALILPKRDFKPQEAEHMSRLTGEKLGKKFRRR